MENASLTLADMASLKNLIEAATARGAFRANEMSTVGGIYDKLRCFLNSHSSTIGRNKLKHNNQLNPHKENDNVETHRTTR
jgi:hypothetical protein